MPASIPSKSLPRRLLLNSPLSCVGPCFFARTLENGEGSSFCCFSPEFASRLLTSESAGGGPSLEIFMLSSFALCTRRCRPRPRRVLPLPVVPLETVLPALIDACPVFPIRVWLVSGVPSPALHLLRAPRLRPAGRALRSWLARSGNQAP